MSRSERYYSQDADHATEKSQLTTYAYLRLLSLNPSVDNNHYLAITSHRTTNIYRGVEQNRSLGELADKKWPRISCVKQFSRNVEINI